MRWPWALRESSPKEPDTFDRLLAVMERRALEEQEVRDAERSEILEEMHRRLLEEDLDDDARRKFELRVSVAEAHGWSPSSRSESET